MDQYYKLQNKIPYWNEVVENYDRSKERLREQCHVLDVRIAMLKWCMQIIQLVCFHI